MSLLHPPPEAIWIADGVRHQIMLRVLPVQRHDMLGPLSVVRMALAVVRRRLSQAAMSADPDVAHGDDGPAQAGATVPDWAGLQGKVSEVERQVAEAVRVVAALRWWDGMHRTPPLPVAEAVEQCTALVQLAMSLRSQQLALQPPTSGKPGLLPVPAVHHALLGLLLHATEAYPRVRHWRLSWDDAALWLEPLAAAMSAPLLLAELPPVGAADAHADAGADAEASDAMTRPISAPALDTLLGTIGWAAQRQPGGWRLAWPTALPQP